MTTLHQQTPESWLDFLNQCADLAGPIALKYFDSEMNVLKKADKSVVTQGDLEIEKAIRKLVETTMPALAVLGEEFGECAVDAPFKLIIDPIDATSNFARRIPIFATLLAIEVQGDIVAGIVYNPATEQRWTTAKGQGAFLNGSRLSVSKVSTIEDSQAFHGALFGREARGELSQLLNLLKPTYRQRGLGDFLMHMYVAQGLGEFAIDFGLKPWDLAPLGIMVEESGGTVTTVDGQPFTPYDQSILASNGQFHQQLVALYNTV